MKKNDVELVISKREAVNAILKSFGLRSELVNVRQGIGNVAYVDLSYLDEYYRLLSSNPGNLWEQLVELFDFDVKKIYSSDSGFYLEFSDNKDSIVRYIDNTLGLSGEVVLGYDQDELVTMPIGNLFVAGENSFDVAAAVAYTVSHKHSAKDTVLAILTEGGPLEDYANMHSTVAYHKYSAGESEPFKSMLSYIKSRPTVSPNLVVILDNVLRPMLRAGVSPAAVYQQAIDANAAVMLFEDIPPFEQKDIHMWLLGNSVSRGVGHWLSEGVAAELGALQYRKEVLESGYDFVLYDHLKEQVVKFNSFPM